MDIVFFGDLKAVSAQAKKLKEKETVAAMHFASEKELSEFRQNAGREGIKVCHIIEKPNEQEIKAFKGKADFLAALGGNVSANKFAAASKQIDFLLQPVGKERFEFDGALANTARDNNVTIACIYSDFLNASQYDRISLFRNYFLLAKLCRQAKAPLRVFSGAHSPAEMRSSADLESFLALLRQSDFDEETD